MTKIDDRSGRDSLIPIARDVIKHAKEGTLRQAKEVMKLPAENYTNPDRFKDELNRGLIEDLILAESIYQNNFFGANVKFNSGMAKIQRGQCIDRELSMLRVSLNS